jgi:hypothetical protein
MGELLGVLMVRVGKRVFQAKSKVVEATPDRLAATGVSVAAD